MASRQSGQKEKHSQHKPSEHVEHEANLGQKKARLDKEKQSELSHLGEMSRAEEKE